jgi:heme ABC exporter ATP-binding subunit CcmA
MFNVTREHRTCNSASASVVEAIRLTIVRNRVPVLCELNLSVTVGEMVALNGPNGAGKSTLLKCLAGALRPDRGEIRWFGNSARHSRADRRRLGFAGHESGLYAELTALENLVFAGRMYGMERPRQRAIELLSVAGLEPSTNRLAGQLSQGLRQRLAIARAVVHEPQLILLDEPSASLDAQGRDWLERMFDEWRRVGRTVCFASHDLRDSRELADRIVSLDAGRIVADAQTHCLPTSLARSA